MFCPRCETATLVERDRDGVAVDVCQSCRGVWLDRGELEKLITRARSEWDDDSPPGGIPIGAPHRHRHETPPRGTPVHTGDLHSVGQHRRKRRWYESFGDLFD